MSDLLRALAEKHPLLLVLEDAHWADSGSLALLRHLARRTWRQPLLIVATYRQRGKVLIAGNGGSAADAQHIAAELVGRFQRDRRAFAAMALTTDSSILTSVGNDYGFDAIFASCYANPNGDRTTAESSTEFYARLLHKVRAQDPARMRDRRSTRVHHITARRLQHRRRRAWAEALRRPTAAHRYCPGAGAESQNNRGR